MKNTFARPRKKIKANNETHTVLPEIDLFDIFRFGVDYGQLLMEQERQGE